MNTNNRKFKWNDSEQANQEAAYDQISEIAEEHEIEVFFSGGEQFATCIEKYGDIYATKKPTFSVADFEKWKQKVVDKVIGQLIEAERSAFLEIIEEKGQLPKYLKDKSK